MAMFEKEDISKRDDFTAMMLALFLGRFGAHRFYVGKYGTGALFFLICNADIVAYILQAMGVPFLSSWVASLIIYLVMAVMCLWDVYAIYSESFTDKDGKIVASKATRIECGCRPLPKSERLVNMGITLCLSILFYAIWFGVIRR